MGLVDKMLGRGAFDDSRKPAGAVAVVVAALLANLAISGVAAAQVRVDIEPFYDDLAAYGTWARSADYDWVWYPRQVPPGWRPYSDGHWVWTDEYGWYWESDRPWGWATFHYGRWFHDRDNGWAWVPGSVWGPAWVAWRWGGGYMGWAPLPPSASLSAGVGFEDDGAFEVSIAPSDWLFVEERSFNAPRAYEVAVAPSYNPWIVQRTRPITRYGWKHRRFVNRGIPLERVEYATRARMPRTQLQASFVHHPRAFRDYHAARRPSHRIDRPSRRIEARPDHAARRATWRDRPVAVSSSPVRRSAPAEPRRVHRGEHRSNTPRWHNDEAAGRRHARAAPHRGDHRRGDHRRGDRRFEARSVQRSRSNERARVEPRRNHPERAAGRHHSRSERRRDAPSAR